MFAASMLVDVCYFWTVYCCHELGYILFFAAAIHLGLYYGGALGKKVLLLQTDFTLSSPKFLYENELFLYLKYQFLGCCK